MHVDSSSLVEEVDRSLRDYLPQSRYFLLDERHVSEEELTSHERVLAEIIQLEEGPNPEKFCDKSLSACSIVWSTHAMTSCVAHWSCRCDGW